MGLITDLIYPQPIEPVFTKNRQTYWRYLCKCGNEFVTYKRRVERGQKTDCGCVKREEFISKRFGRLTVIGYDGGGKWSCLCDCGNSVLVQRNSLTRGLTKSCGCLRKEIAKKRGESGEIENREEAIYRRVYVALKSRHINVLRCSESELISFEDWRRLVTKPCFYCGRQPFREVSDDKSDTKLKLNGLDRINNKLGYVKENVVPCCYDCNVAKSEMNLSEFVAWMDRVSTNLPNIKALLEIIQ